MTEAPRLDEWETYLGVWSPLRRHTTDTLTYGDGPHSAATGPRAAPYVVRRTPGQVHVHWLWLLSHRKDVIVQLGRDDSDRNPDGSTK